MTQTIRDFGAVLLTAFVIFVLIMFATGRVNASTPPGQDGSCHGANMTDCRPDPQPSHGQDCTHQPPGNPNGNDDHCLPTPSPEVSPSLTPVPSMTPTPSATPIPQPTPTPSAVSSPSPTTTPSVTVSPSPITDPAPSVERPAPTLPPTDTTSESGQGDDPLHIALPIILAFLLFYSIVGVLMHTGRARR